MNENILHYGNQLIALVPGLIGLNLLVRPEATLQQMEYIIPSEPKARQLTRGLARVYDSDRQFEIVCNSYSTGGDQIGPSFELGDLETCVSLCAGTTGCKVALFDRSQFLCYLLDGTDGPAPNNLYDMAALLSIPTTTAMPSTTSMTTTTQSAGPAPTPCNQLDNPTYIDGVKFSIICGSQSTGGNQIDFSNQLRSLTECMTFCVGNLACRAVTFNNAWQECALYDGFNGFMSDLQKDMAVVASRPVTSTTEDPTAFSTTTSSDSSLSTSEFTTSTLYTTDSASTSDSPGTTSLSPSSDLTPGSKNDQSETLIRPTGSQEDSYPSYKVDQPAVPTSAGGSDNDTSPGQGNTQPSVSAQGSQRSNSNAPINPSGPSSPESLTTETSTIRTPQFETSAVPPHHSQVPSGPKDAPYATPVAVSGAHSYEISPWITMGAILGVALLL
ncbi:hypothetical protein FPSE5266_05544 [Fusarium pseudograminearum]|nr:hypothetical protein FPSE5266_05544 [Fusarium pseudograminearum]